MLYLACGTCGVSQLSLIFPPFHYWLSLLPLALLLAFVIQQLEGKLTLFNAIEILLVASLAYVMAAVSFAFLVIPLAFLISLLYFFAKLFSKNRASRFIAGAMLISLAGTAGYAYL